jgi:DNA-binding LacI/PurR family transcriptional regulator
VIPPLTVMALPTEDMGRTAAEMVLEQINSGGRRARRARAC